LNDGRVQSKVPVEGRASPIFVITRAETGNLHVSAITPWEIAMLVSKARLRFCCGVGE
jgi:PIN domain nuclease of toxin-antitoxin system